MASTNPISVGYAAIWSALINSAAFTALVKSSANTQINFQTSGVVPPKAVQAADRPAVRLGEGKLQYTRQHNSKAIALGIGYPLEISSGQFQIDKIGLLNTVVLQALDAAGVNLGLSWVYKWELSSGLTKPLDTGNKRSEWTTVLTINVIMWIPNDEFRGVTFT